MRNIYLDMDGVLANFVYGARVLVGINPDHFDPYPSEEYFRAQILEATGFKSLGTFWDSLSPTFWASLPPIEAGFRLFNELYRKHRNNLYICTTVMDGKSAVGKWAWLVNWLPCMVSHGLDHVIFIGQKELLAKPLDILIDDRHHILEKWGNAGGRSLLFRESNINHILEFCNE